MKRDARTTLSLFFAALTLAAALAGVAALPSLDLQDPAQVAQSTSAILEERAA